MGNRYMASPEKSGIAVAAGTQEIIGCQRIVRAGSRDVPPHRALMIPVGYGPGRIIGKGQAGDLNQPFLPAYPLFQDLQDIGPA